MCREEKFYICTQNNREKFKCNRNVNCLLDNNIFEYFWDFFRFAYNITVLLDYTLKFFLLSWLVQQPKEKASFYREIRGRGLGVGQIQQAALVALPHHL